MGCYAFVSVAKLAKSWGVRLAELRRAAGLSAAAVVKHLAGFGIALDRASIYAYENGRVGAPDAAVVWGLARIYNVKLEDLVTALLDARTPIIPQTRRQASLVQFTSAEMKVLERLRELKPAARKSCIDFIDFQLAASMSRGRKRSSRRSA